MWLLDTTSLALSAFFNDDTPYYAIFSHTWGAEEVSFQDIRGPHEAISNKAGFRKIKDCCASALDAGFKYVWIDTCCIDKTNSTELSEAINSMFCWYENAVTCYAYLEDVKPDCLRFDASRWFERGWTLQELIAPTDVLFFDSYWNEIGSRASLAEQIEKITGVPVGLLLMATSLRDHCVAEIMCWAACRTTTRLEDRAYSLLGLFGVSMPLIYGEGENAFFRLQLEIMKTTTDHSLFAWIPADVHGRRQGVLATTPDHFDQSGKYRRLEGEDESSFEMTNLGLRISLPCVSIGDGSSSRFAYLQCKHDSQDSVLGIWLMEATNPEGGPLGRFYRSHLGLLTRDSPLWADTKPRPTLLHIIQPDNRLSRRFSMHTFFGGPPCLVDYNDLIQDGYCLENLSELWDPVFQSCRNLRAELYSGLAIFIRSLRLGSFPSSIVTD